ncbi:MAG: hypothetical protein ABI325_09935 [Ginsengibacter sp.]
MKSNKLLFTLSLLIFTSCGSHETNDKRQYYSNGEIKSGYLPNGAQKNTLEILYYKNGNLKSITNYINSLKEGEQLNFYESNGKLESKVTFKNDSANGVAYWFYKSGSMKALRYYVNDKECYFGIDYWDDPAGIFKSSLHFDDKGHLYYKKNFDSTGLFVNEEGKKE